MLSGAGHGRRHTWVGCANTGGPVQVGVWRLWAVPLAPWPSSSRPLFLSPCLCSPCISCCLWFGHVETLVPALPLSPHLPGWSSSAPQSKYALCLILHLLSWLSCWSTSFETSRPLSPTYSPYPLFFLVGVEIKDTRKGGSSQDLSDGECIGCRSGAHP